MNSLIFIVGLFLPALIVVGVTALDPPLNVAVEAGQPATFSCTSDETIRWDYYAYQSNQPRTVYNGQKVADVFVNKVTVSKSGRTTSLTVKRTELDDAGYFACFESGKTSKYTASLIVLSSKPYCMTNLSAPSFTVDRGDSVQVSCTVNFSGNWTPIIACSPGIDDRALNNVTRTTIPHTVTYMKTVAGSSTVNGTVFNCSTSFRQGVAPTASVPQSTTSDIIPSYYDSWSSPPVHVTDRGNTTPARTQSTLSSTQSQQQTPVFPDDTANRPQHVTTRDEQSTTTPTTTTTTSAIAATTTTSSPITNELQFSLSAGHVIAITLSLVGLLVFAVIIIVVLVVVVFNRRRLAAEANILHPPMSIAPGPNTHIHYRNDTMPAGGTWQSMASSSNSYHSGGTMPDNSHYSMIREFPFDSPTMKLGLATGAMNNPEYVCGSETYMEITDAVRRQQPAALPSGYQVPSGLRSPVKPQPNYQTLDRNADDEASASGGSTVPLIDPYAIKRLMGHQVELPDPPVNVTEYLTPAEIGNAAAGGANKGNKS